MAGELNGTNVLVAVETTPGGGIFADIGGITTNSLTFNNGLIDITNKSSASFRELLAGEGLQSMDLSIECVFNTDANFAIMQAAALSKAALNYQIDRGGQIIDCACIIASWAENDKYTVSISLQSTGAITGL